MTDWPVKTLGDLFEFKNGRGFKKTEWSTSGLPIIRIQNLNSDSASYNYFSGTFDEGILVKSGDLLFSWSGSIGTSFGPHVWRRSSGLLNQHIFKVSPKVPMNTDYAHYCLRVITAEIERSVNGAVGLVHITKEKLNKFEIPVPPLEEQKRIVALLDAATARVTELTACYEQARTHANNLFTCALSSALEGNPDWPVKTLGDLLEVSIGGIWGNEAGEDEVDVFVYRSTELIKDGQLKEEITVRRSVTARQLDSRKLEEGDLLLEKSGGGPKTPVGRVGLVKVLPGLSVCSNFMQLMRPRKKDVLPVYLHYFLNHFHVAGHTEDLQNNSTNIRNLKTTEYMEVEIPLPPLDEQKRIVARLDSMRVKTSEMVAAYDAKLIAAKNLRQSILEAAFEGDL